MRIDEPEKLKVWVPAAGELKALPEEISDGELRQVLADGGFPVVYGRLDAEDRWSGVLERLGIDSLTAYYEDGTVYKELKKTSLTRKIRFGVMGAGRGQSMMRYCTEAGNAELVAVCDKYPQRLQEVRETYGQGHDIAYYTDFDEFIQAEMDCVVLANYAHQHAPFAIRCLKAGKNVMSEVLPAQNLAEAVELIETIEKTGKRYFYAEDFCYFPATKRIKEMAERGELGEIEYAEGEYMHRFTPGSWNRLTFADPQHWRNNMSAFFYCTHSLGPMIHITGKRPVRVVGLEGPFTKRMYRLGAKAGAFGVEMVTLEDGCVLKSLHGIGATRHSYYYCFYGENGRVETARRDTNAGYVRTLYSNVGPEDPKADPAAEPYDTADRLSESAWTFGHYGADYYMMHNLVQALRGDRNADTIDVFEAMDMWLPGMFAYRSVLQGGIPLDVPDFRDPAVREQWKNDTSCTDPAAAGDMLQPVYSKGTPDIPQEIYDEIYRQAWDKGEQWT